VPARLTPRAAARRAERFNTDYVKPEKVKPELRMEVRKERLRRDGFATGIDLFTQVGCLAAGCWLLAAGCWLW
jgi:hypothetical protein